MHFSEDVAGIILEYCTDTVLSVMERMQKMCNELDVLQINLYIAMEEWDDQDVIIMGNTESFIVEWRDRDSSKGGEYNFSCKTYKPRRNEVTVPVIL